MVRCSKCILPDTIPHISFDDNGVCNYCINFSENQNVFRIDYTKKGKVWEGLIEQARRKRNKNN